MAASRTERRVYLWRIVTRVKPAVAELEHGKRATLDEVISILEAEFTAGRARSLLSFTGRLFDEDSDEVPNPKNQIYIADIKRDPSKSAVTILVNRGDPNAAHPAFLGVVGDGKVRVSHPRPPEAQGWSAHLCISTIEKKGAYRACFERATGSSGSLVLALFARVIDRALSSNPTYFYESSKIVSGKRRIERKPYRPTFEIERIPSEKLIEDLKNGELSRITLTRSTTAYAGTGVSRLVTRQERKLILHTAKADASDIANLVDSITKYAREKHYEKITFHLDNLPGGMSNTPTISLMEEDALEVLYVRAQRLTDFSEFLENAYEKVYYEIEEKMIKVIETVEDW